MKSLLFSTLICFSTFALADTWSDPNWQEMLDKSHVVTIAEVVEGGEFGARYRIIQTIKGQVPTSEIWVTGFSNKYGPIDTMRVGERYYLFLFKSDTSKYNSPYHSSSNFADEETGKKAYESFNFVMSQPNGYYTWTPSAGTYRIDQNRIQYSLLETTEYSENDYNSLTEFQDFISAYFNSSEREKFHKRTIKELKKANRTDSQSSSEYLMMLFLTGNQKLEDPIRSTLNSQHEFNRYALCKQLGLIETAESRDLLEQLLTDSSGIVQGEAVRQLSKYEPELIGPLFLNALNASSSAGVYPSLMSPIRNSLDGGQLELIRALGEIKHEQAAEVLLPLLRTSDSYVFEIVANSLVKIGIKNDDWLPELQWHFDNDTAKQILEVCVLITEQNLEAAKKMLMEYISNHDKTIHPDKAYTISWWGGLAHFDDSETREFLINEFNSVLKLPKPTTYIDNKKDWIIEFIRTFEKLKIEGMSEAIRYYLNSDYDLDSNKVNSIVMRAYFKYLLVSSTEEDLDFLKELKNLGLSANELVKLDELIASIEQPTQDE